MSPKYIPIEDEPPRVDRWPNDIPWFAWRSRGEDPSALHWLGGVVAVKFVGGSWISVEDLDRAQARPVDELAAPTAFP